MLDILKRAVRQAVDVLRRSNFIRSIVFDFRYYILGRTPVIIYQMGKVGSSSVKESLLAHRNRFMLYHTHSLAPEILIDAIQRYTPPKTNAHKHWLWIYNHIIVRRKARIKYITLIRDPIAVNVSGYFQNLSLWMEDENAHTRSMDELISFFLNVRSNIDYVLNWFDRSLKSTPGIDVFAYEFPKDQGYTIIEKGNTSLLIMKLETSDATKEKAISEFLGLDEFELISANVGDEKKYADVYAKFKEQLEVPLEDIERAYASKLANHFYTEDEIDTFKAKWLKDRTFSPQ